MESQSQQQAQAQQQMQQQSQQQAQKQSQKRSAQKLRETRNTLIQKYAQTGVSVKALAYMFSLSEQTIRAALQGITAVQAKQFSIEQLESARENIKKTLSQQGYNAGEIEYILGKGSLAQAETIRNLQEQIKYYKGLEFQYHTDIESLKQEKAKLNTDWQKKYEEQEIIIKTFLAESESKIAELEKEKEDLSKRLQKEMEVSLSLGDKLLKAEEDNVFLKEGQSRLDGEIKYLTADVQNLEQEKQEASERAADLLEVKGSLEQEKQSLTLEIAKLKKVIGDLTAKIQGLEQEKAKLDAGWQKKYNDKLTELKVAFDDKRNKIQTLSDEKRGLISATSGLQKEKEDLLSQIDILRQQLSERGQETESCIKTRYTNSDIERMIEVYKQSRKNKSKTLEILHSEGIMISYRHLIRILQKRGFKSTKSRG